MKIPDIGRYFLLQQFQKIHEEQENRIRVTERALEVTKVLHDASELINDSDVLLYILIFFKKKLGRDEEGEV